MLCIFYLYFTSFCTAKPSIMIAYSTEFVNLILEYSRKTIHGFIGHLVKKYFALMGLCLVLIIFAIVFVMRHIKSQPFLSNLVEYESNWK